MRRVSPAQITVSFCTWRGIQTQNVQHDVSLSIYYASFSLYLDNLQFAIVKLDSLMCVPHICHEITTVIHVACVTQQQSNCI